MSEVLYESNDLERADTGDVFNRGGERVEYKDGVRRRDDPDNEDKPGDGGDGVLLVRLVSYIHEQRLAQWR